VPNVGDVVYVNTPWGVPLIGIVLIVPGVNDSLLQYYGISPGPTGTEVMLIPADPGANAGWDTPTIMDVGTSADAGTYTVIS